MSENVETRAFWREWKGTIEANSAGAVSRAVSTLVDMAHGRVPRETEGMCVNFTGHGLDDHLLCMCYDSLGLRLGYPIEALASDFVACGVALPDDAVPGEHLFNIEAYDMLPKWSGPYGERRRALAGKCAGILQGWLDAGVFEREAV